jgi:hypothetical protein
MPKPQRKATKTTKTKTKGTAPTRKKVPTKNQTSQSSHKRKPENDPTSSEEPSDAEPTHPPHKRRAKRLADIEANIVESGPEVVIDVPSSSERDDTSSSDNKV